MLFGILITILFAVAVLKIVFPFVVAPTIFKLSSWMAANPQFLFSDIKYFPKHTISYFSSMIQSLESEGFVVASHLCQRDMAPGATGYITILIHYANKDSAALVHMRAENDALAIETSYLEFNSGYADGCEINTNNCSDLNVFKQVPEIRVFRFPDVKDPRRLYSLHRELSARYGSNAEKTVPSKGMEVMYISSSTIRDIAKQAEFGYYYLDKENERYRPTWKGAFLMTWKLAWPIYPIRKSMLRNREKALLKSLE